MPVDGPPVPPWPGDRHPRPTPADPLPPERLADRLMEVFALVGPLYRRVQRKIEQDNAARASRPAVRAVLDLLHTHGDLTVPQLGLPSPSAVSSSSA